MSQSLPWASSRDDRRTLPVHRYGSNSSVTSDVKISEYLNDVIITKSEEFIQLKTEFIRTRQLITCLSIDIELPLRISKLIFSRETRKYLLSNKIIINNVVLVVSSFDSKIGI